MMGMKIFWAGFLGIGIGLIVVFFMGVHTYEGTETFQSHEEYQVFKETIEDLDAKLLEAQTLSSDPPIITRFKVEVDNDVKFPYGSRAESDWSLILIGSVMIIATLAIGGWLLLEDRGSRKEQ